VEGLVYIATHENAAYLGPATEREIAAQIAASCGPSGPNSEYLLELAKALRELGKFDAHVFEIERHLAEITSKAPTPSFPRSANKVKWGPRLRGGDGVR
jgi:cation transport regulator ChaC